MFRSAFVVPEPRCKLCGDQTRSFDVVDFNKFCNAEPYGHGFSGIPVHYYRCGVCECIFTPFFDSWSAEDFRRSIYNDDYILVDPDYASARPQSQAAEWLVRFDILKDAKVLDFGAGSGGFAERMSANGYSFSSYDPFSSPSMPEGPFDVVSAFEVVEHSPRPLETFETILSCMGERKIVIVGQSIQPDDIMQIRGNWWYIAPRNGHCTTYSERSFRYLADRYSLTCAFNFGYIGFFSHPDDVLSRNIMARVADW